MPTETQTCPWCSRQAETKQDERRPGEHVPVLLVKGCGCGPYYIRHTDLVAAGKDVELEDFARRRIAALLKERRLKGLPPPFLYSGKTDTPSPFEGTVLRWNDLLSQWPATVPELLDRCLCNLARHAPDAGRVIELKRNCAADFLLFTSDPHQAAYYIEALKRNKWINDPLGHLTAYGLVITPEGWARVAQLTRGAERRRNPAFVAMWFGGEKPADREKMTRRFEDGIRVACQNCGWSAERVDSTEHNDSIIDRIVEMIRVAPFVIADLSDGNQGVYYEAGFARGIGRDVIYLVQEQTNVHFDLTGVNHVRWRELEDLRIKLGNRIFGTMGRGPHTFDKVEGQ